MTLDRIDLIVLEQVIRLKLLNYLVELFIRPIRRQLADLPLNNYLADAFGSGQLCR